MIRIKILWLPITPHEASRIFELRRYILLLLLSHDFCFHPLSCVSPLIHRWRRLLIATFLLQLTILMLKPVLFHFLLLKPITRIVVEVGASTLKSVLLGELDLLLLLRGLINRVKYIKRLLAHCPLSPLKRTCRRNSSQRRISLCTRIGSTRIQRHIINRAHVCEEQTSFLIIFLREFSLVSFRIFLLNFTDCTLVVIELSPLKFMYSNVCRWYRRNYCPLACLVPFARFEHASVVVFGLILVR